MESPIHFNFTRDVLERWSAATPDALALWWVDGRGGERRFNFRELADAAGRASHYFHSLGIRNGDRVLVILPRVPQWWIGMLGLIRLGAVPIPGTPLLTPRDISYRIEAAEVHAVVTDPDGAKKVDNFAGIRFLIGGKLPGW